MRFHELNNELLISIAGHLQDEDLKHFALVCRKFAMVACSDVIWKERLYNQFGITYKLPTEQWRDMYNRKTEDPAHARICPHIGYVTPKILEPYAAKYQTILNWLDKNLNCATCRTNCADSGLCLYIWKNNVRHRCKDCAYSFHKAVEGHGILFRMNVLQMYCFDCKRLLGETRGDSSEAHYVDMLLETLTHDSEKGKESMRKREQCMKERLLYAEHADRASVVANGKYYFVERVWLISWFLRLCDGKIGVGPVANDELEDPNREGKLNPNSRPRGNFKGGFSIVSPLLWNYLVETYGLSGGTYTSGILQ
ncbi:hypothetical protein BDF20DRAFT_902664 [Mycotypha africana]|uniref:uncharacterized protein n=1 Tax=Mycotypha africana TaxID=64632 RepID=UPI002301BB17|nr:uncharacterized protein BDF20DRAFT_902664 [Mycotypha africana]KAI8967117.1 hypothetical protein BDF20DRAFT_902664 [Mycotypha africana]